MDRKTKCRKCKYSRWISGVNRKDIELCCVYILITGEPRREAAGETCTKFQPTKKKYVGLAFKKSFPEFTAREKNEIQYDNRREI